MKISNPQEESICGEAETQSQVNAGNLKEIGIMATEIMFHLNQEVQAVEFQNGDTLSIMSEHVDRMSIVMENGQMAGVPWVACWLDGVVVSKYNVALLVAVDLKQ